MAGHFRQIASGDPSAHQRHVFRPPYLGRLARKAWIDTPDLRVGFDLVSSSFSLLDGLAVGFRVGFGAGLAARLGGGVADGLTDRALGWRAGDPDFERLLRSIERRASARFAASAKALCRAAAWRATSTPGRGAAIFGVDDFDVTDFRAAGREVAGREVVGRFAAVDPVVSSSCSCS